MASRILISGRPGIGKTTVVKKVLALGIRVAGGFLTEEIRREGVRVGFRVRDIHRSKEGTLAHVDRRGGPRVGKYVVDVESFDRIGVTALREGMHREGCIVIDEMGKMELCSEAFREVVAEILDSNCPVLGTIPVHRDPFLNGLRRRGDVTLFEITASNRDELPLPIAKLLGFPDHPSP